jgi:hypothetical protein
VCVGHITHEATAVRLGSVTIHVIGAGLGRPGTLSLNLALEQLLGGWADEVAAKAAFKRHNAAVRADVERD